MLPAEFKSCNILYNFFKEGECHVNYFYSLTYCDKKCICTSWFISSYYTPSSSSDCPWDQVAIVKNNMGGVRVRCGQLSSDHLWVDIYKKLFSWSSHKRKKDYRRPSIVVADISITIKINIFIWEKFYSKRNKLMKYDTLWFIL